MPRTTIESAASLPAPFMEAAAWPGTATRSKQMEQCASRCNDAAAAHAEAFAEAFAVAHAEALAAAFASRLMC
jgi:hypothetical protein